MYNDLARKKLQQKRKAQLRRSQASLNGKLESSRYSLLPEGPDYVYQTRIAPYKLRTSYSGPTAGTDILKKMSHKSVSEFGK